MYDKTALLARVLLCLGEGGKEGVGEGGGQTLKREALAWLEGAREEMKEALLHAVVECLEG